MSWLPKRDKLDPVQASAVDFAVAQDGSGFNDPNFQAAFDRVQIGCPEIGRTVILIL